MTSPKPIIVVPIYKAHLSDSEGVSLIQCCKILGKYDIALVCPNGLNVKEYSDTFKKFDMRFEVEEFDKSFFESTKTYNILMLNADFYKRFSTYDFMLVYQLDAYVFKDELEYWCEQSYDFIGAPWNRYDFLRNKLKLLETGLNGGFSLRKIASFIKVLSDEDKGKMILKDFISSGRNEDGFFSVQAKMIDPKFKVAPYDVAMNFSFEYRPEILYEMTGHKLPFGCHAWMKCNPQFWSNILMN